MKTHNKIVAACLLSFLASAAAMAEQARTVTLDKEEYLDKCRGAWAGQMVGVCYGEPYQFRATWRPFTEPLRPWQPKFVEGAIRQDDVYVELTFLGSLEKHGLDITPEQAGRDFAETPYPLWHANLYGRLNIQNGIMPPLSGHPKYNRHADDIDFQIEADVFGIICPALPVESNRLCDIFGHIMNYGDGVYGGMFMAGMYTAAYFEPDDVEKVIAQGLACVPEESTFHQCISDTVRWCKDHSDNWLTVWNKIEDKYNDDVDCIPGNPHNIDAKINAAYTVVGLMFGQGDLEKTIEFSTRCSQDADSSTANAGGVAGCMKGYKALDPNLVGSIPTIADENFLGTDYSFETLAPACLRVAEKIVARTGGDVTDDALIINVQRPEPPAEVETWPDKAEMVNVPVTGHEVSLWNRDFRLVEIEGEIDAGYYPREYGRTNVLQIMPIKPNKPVAVEAEMAVPAASKSPRLSVELASEGMHGDYLFKAYVNDWPVGKVVVRTDDGEFATERFDLPAQLAGKIVTVRLEFHANDWSNESAYVRDVQIR